MKFGIRKPYRGNSGFEWQIRSVVFFWRKLEKDAWWDVDRDVSFFEWHRFDDYGGWLLRVGNFSVFTDPFWNGFGFAEADEIAREKKWKEQDDSQR
jgi:hypothetical protein